MQGSRAAASHQGELTARVRVKAVSADSADSAAAEQVRSAAKAGPVGGHSAIALNATEASTTRHRLATFSAVSTPASPGWARTGRILPPRAGCHGTPPGQFNPPVGVGGELGIGTLAVGRHVSHLTASGSHAAFLCSDCHVVPVAGNVMHAGNYIPTPDLSTPGHHGDVAFSGAATGALWNVDATAGAPIDRRGTCVLACHSDGRGGPPNVMPYWAGPGWVSSCANCHDNPPNNGEHNKHVMNENIACTVCHDPASSPSHVNGQSDVLPTINGPMGGVAVDTTTPCGTGNVSRDGTCHGENHNNKCWD